MSAARDEAYRDEPVMDGSIHVVTPEESWERFDRAAHYYLGMGGEEFLQAWYGGKFDDDPDRPEVLMVAMMRPLGR